ncbi:MAG: isoprenylcysteine carboxylmethyltransferase family protein [Pseudomonadota bacterium]
MSEDAAHHGGWRTADWIFAAALLLGLALDYFFPLTFQEVLPRLMLHLIGAPLLIAGTALVFLGKKELARCAQPSEPGHSTTQLVKSGVFSHSRNPLYVGILLAFMGLAIATNMPWWLFLAIPVMLVIQWLLVVPEERYLEKKFGEEYQAYRQAVRRWC